MRDRSLFDPQFGPLGLRPAPEGPQIAAAGDFFDFSGDCRAPLDILELFDRRLSRLANHIARLGSGSPLRSFCKSASTSSNLTAASPREVSKAPKLLRTENRSFGVRAPEKPRYGDRWAIGFGHNRRPPDPTRREFLPADRPSVFRKRTAAVVERIQFIETPLDPLAPFIVLDETRQTFEYTEKMQQFRTAARL